VQLARVPEVGAPPPASTIVRARGDSVVAIPPQGPRGDAFLTDA